MIKEEKINIITTIKTNDEIYCSSQCNWYNHDDGGDYPKHESWYCNLFYKELENYKKTYHIKRCDVCMEYSKINRMQEILK